MKIKSIASLLFIGILIFTACKKTPEPLTYELNLKAIRSTTGNTNFAQIRYKDATGTIKTLINQTTDFTTTFPIESGFNILLSVDGIITNGNATAPATISYQVDELQGKERRTMCQEVIGSVGGVGGTLTIRSSVDRKFDGQKCQ
jgi:hypothetical protein